MKKLFSKKPEKVEITMEDEETGRSYTTDAEPGTPEFAAAVKQMVDTAISEVSKKIGKKNWDKHCTLMFACNYDNEEGLAQCIDGNQSQLLALMAVTIHQMAEAEVERQKFLPNRTGGNQVIAALMMQLTSFVNMMDHDDGNENSQILTP